MLLNFLCQFYLLRLAILKIKNKISSINSKEEKGKMKREKVGYSTISTREPVEVLMQIHDEVILEVREDVLEEVLKRSQELHGICLPFLSCTTFNSYFSWRRLESFVRCKNKLNL